MTALQKGARLGAYEIIAPLGAGGMGEVYRARDSRLGRDVAIKVLPAGFGMDAERVARFEREARMLAALNHPHIATIHGIEDHGATATSGPAIRALVMELIEGETLAERILPGRIPVPEALAIARQIASALESAHDKGIIHRDLKPANIMITPAGVVKVLDFGLAKPSGAGLIPDLSQSPTITNEGTRAGVILGTAAYMSPEQARGQSVDQRTDVWAFGCVLFEMLTGRKAFGGATVSDAVAAILEREPNWSALPRSTPPGVRTLLQRCLQKDPARRLRDISTARLDIEDAQKPGWREGLPVGAPKAIGMAAILLVALGIAAALWWRFGSDRRAATSVSAWVQLTNFPDAATQPALSPDGRMLAFIRGPGTFTTSGQLYIKLLPAGEPVPLTTDEGQVKMSPAFSPDGGRIAYTVTRAHSESSWDTWIVPAFRGEPWLWLPNASGLTWTAPDRLLFSAFKNPPHMAIVTASENRADVRDVYVPAHERAMAHRSYLSPDGRSVLVAEMDERGVWLPCRLVPLDGSSVGRPVGPDRARCTAAAWSPDGKWMYFTADAGSGFHIWRRQFPDGPAEQITSGPNEEEGLAVAPDGNSLITSVGTNRRAVWVHDASGDRAVSLEGYAFNPLISADGGKLCYRTTGVPGSGQTPSQLWLTNLKSGRTERVFAGQMVTGYDLSADDRVVAAVVESDGKTRVWLAWLDGRQPPRRISSSEGDNPRFASRGEIVFRAADGNATFLFRIREDGTGRQRGEPMPTFVLGRPSPDGQWLSAWSANELWAYSTTGAPRVRIFSSPWASRLRWSPDGRRLYLSLQIGDARAFEYGRTYVLPLKPGSMLPSMPNGGFQSEAELEAVPGVEILPHGDMSASASPARYAFSRSTSVRNLYRIPLP